MFRLICRVVWLAAFLGPGATLEGDVIRISGGGTQVLVQPQYGGRIVSLQFSSSGELLAAAPANWHPEISACPPLNTKWLQDAGQVIWAGPQSTWWADETALQQKGDRKVNWPPDPDWSLACFEVIERSAARIVMRSPRSRVTGLQLTKTVDCLSDGRVRVHAMAVNHAEKPAYRDLWFNFRAPAQGEEFVPVASMEDVRREKSGGSRFVNGMHTLELENPPGGGRTDNKVYIKPSAGWIAYLGKGGFFVIAFEVPPVSQVATGHSPVEIYRSLASDGAAVLELETHSPCSEIPPHGRIEAEQVWTFVAYRGGESAEARAKFLREKIDLP